MKKVGFYTKINKDDKRKLELASVLLDKPMYRIVTEALEMYYKHLKINNQLKAIKK